MSRTKAIADPRRLVVSGDRHSRAADAFRLLRSNLRYASVDVPLRALTVTSALAGEGKSLTAANLAIAMAQAGADTLLVDADLRKPGQRNLFTLPEQMGLPGLLVGKASLDQGIWPTSVEHLSLVAGDTIPPNPAELLQSSTMKSLHGEFLERYELVIYDAPPVLLAVEALDLSVMAGAALLVVKAEKTPKDAVRDAVGQLRRARVDVLGTVLNGVRPRRGYGYYDYHYA